MLRDMRSALLCLIEHLEASKSSLCGMTAIEFEQTGPDTTKQISPEISPFEYIARDEQESLLY